MPFKLENDADFKLSKDLLTKNYLQSGFPSQQHTEQGEESTEKHAGLEQQASWRFVKQKKLLL